VLIVGTPRVPRGVRAGEPFDPVGESFHPRSLARIGDQHPSDAHPNHAAALRAVFGIAVDPAPSGDRFDSDPRSR
jgi:hypothetical protein